MTACATGRSPVLSSGSVYTAFPDVTITSNVIEKIGVSGAMVLAHIEGQTALFIQRDDFTIDHSIVGQLRKRFR